MRKMCELIGWPADEGDGIFTPGNRCRCSFSSFHTLMSNYKRSGGAIANMYAMNAARHHHYPRAKPLGMSEVPTLCVFTSEEVESYLLVSLPSRSRRTTPSRALHPFWASAPTTASTYPRTALVE